MKCSCIKQTLQAKWTMSIWKVGVEKMSANLSDLTVVVKHNVYHLVLVKKILYNNSLKKYIIFIKNVHNKNLKVEFCF